MSVASYAMDVKMSMRRISKEAKARKMPEVCMKKSTCAPGRLHRRHIKLACNERWHEVYSNLDQLKARVDDFDEVKRSLA